MKRYKIIDPGKYYPLLHKNDQFSSDLRADFSLTNDAIIKSLADRYDRYIRNVSLHQSSIGGAEGILIYRWGTGRAIGEVLLLQLDDGYILIGANGTELAGEPSAISSCAREGDIPNGYYRTQDGFLTNPSNWDPKNRWF